jgi:alpha-glucosidase
MQWDASKHAGFSTARPWLPLSDDAAKENVVNLDADAKSILSLYRMLIALRKKRPELVTGAYEPVAAQGDLLVYRRQLDGRAVTVALNLGAEPVSVASTSLSAGKVLLSTFLDRSGEEIEDILGLRGNEGVIVGEDHVG